MRLKGTLVEWNDSRGFGFIEPTGGGGRVFCHIKAFEVRVRRPMPGDQLTYELTKGSDGRTSAANVRPVGLEDAAYQQTDRAKFEKGVGQARGVGASSRWKPTTVVLALLVAGVSYVLTHKEQLLPGTNELNPPTTSQQTRSNDALGDAFSQRRSDVQVQASGVVERILSDDSDGSRHQRFIVRLASGQTVLIAHNIDLAPRVASLSTGDRVEFYGEYEWNAQGGVIHWTHHDPNGGHVGGWIKHGGKQYQ